MTPTGIFSQTFGGAYLGMIGSSYRPTQMAELIAAGIGMAVSVILCVREQHREKRLKAPLRLGR